MATRIQIDFQGKKVWAEVMPVQQSQENWNQYLLSDGSVVRMKTVVTDVLRIENDYDPEGNPIYFIKSANILSVNAPDELRKKS